MPVDPLLVFASRSVLQRAEELLPGRTLEVEVTKAICTDRKRDRLPGMPELPPRQRYVMLGDAIVAVIEKGQAKLTERKAWHVLRLLRVPKHVAAGFPPPPRAVRGRVRDAARGRA